MGATKIGRTTLRVEEVQNGPRGAGIASRLTREPGGNMQCYSEGSKDLSQEKMEPLGIQGPRVQKVE